MILWWNIAGPVISRIGYIQLKAHPGATIDNIIDYTKPAIGQKPDIAIIHSEMSNLTKDVNTLSRVRKVVVAVKEIDTKEKIKLGFLVLLVEVI